MTTIRNKATVSIVCASVFLSAGCQTMSDVGDSISKSMDDMGIKKEHIGTTLGVAGGILLGSRFGGGAGRYAAIAAGALVGGYIGNMIGAKLDAQDEAAVAQKSAEAFESTPDGQAVQWANPDTKTNATLTPVNTRTETRSMKIARSRSVQAPDEMNLIGKPYVVSATSVNVRSGPSTRTAVVRQVNQGEIYNAVGQVKGGNWIMVASKGKSFGYIHDSLLIPASQQQINAEMDKRVMARQTPASAAPASDAVNLDAPSGANASAQGQQTASNDAIDLDTVEFEAIDLDAMAPTLRKSDGVDLDAMFADDKDVVIETASVSTQCRDMQADVSTEQENSQGSFTACKAPDGAWELN